MAFCFDAISLLSLSLHQLLPLSLVILGIVAQSNSCRFFSYAISLLIHSDVSFTFDSMNTSQRRRSLSAMSKGDDNFIRILWGLGNRPTYFYRTFSHFTLPRSRARWPGLRATIIYGDSNRKHFSLTQWNCFCCWHLIKHRTEHEKLHHDIHTQRKCFSFEIIWIIENEISILFDLCTHKPTIQIWFGEANLTKSIILAIY